MENVNLVIGRNGKMAHDLIGVCGQIVGCMGCFKNVRYEITDSHITFDMDVPANFPLDLLGNVRDSIEQILKGLGQYEELHRRCCDRSKPVW
ncbi:hypothetical protein [Bacteroides heparinolyticus]|uniref:hypothetical protein n=1 Tax=Prevotella heparinolytica TaxID=28113 RepID=UPI003AF039B7